MTKRESITPHPGRPRGQELVAAKEFRQSIAGVRVPDCLVKDAADTSDPHATSSHYARVEVSISDHALEYKVVPLLAIGIMIAVDEVNRRTGTDQAIQFVIEWALQIKVA